MPRGGLPYISALVREKSRDGPPSIAYDASVKGAPANPMSGTRPCQLLPGQPNRVEHIAELGPRIEPSQARHIVVALQGISMRGPSPLTKSKGNAHRLEGEQQVREDDGGVDLDCAGWAAA